MSRSSWRRLLEGAGEIALEWDSPMACHTTLRVGGAVACLARPHTLEALRGLLARVRDEGVPWFLLGGGSNLLAPDDPMDAVAVRLGAFAGEIGPAKMAGDEVQVYVGGGVRMACWLRFCLRHGLRGMEFLAGIPGTVGGGLWMNAGADGGCMADGLLWLDCLDASGERIRLERRELEARYRSMGCARGWVLLGGCFRLRPGKREAVRKRLKYLVNRRREVQPSSRRTAGCVFKNPPGSSAGRLLDRAGVKGMRVGDAQVSRRHANWIVNRGGARSRDVLTLMERMEERARESFGVRLEREIRVVDF